MRNIFLSFLGTNNYIPCNYHPEHEEERVVEHVSYVQQALISLYCQHFTTADRIVVFTTRDAKRINWEDNGQYNPISKAYDLPNQGLKSILHSMRLAPAFEQVDIVEGFSEAEIWAIFQTVYEVLEPGDKVVFDITHAFRSLPMLGMSLIHYAKAMKNIEVAGVYYGAFEKLGPAHIVRTLPIDERNAPILNLKAFSDLQDWTTAAQDFVQYGTSDRWRQLVQAEIRPIMASSKGQDVEAGNLQSVAKGIGDLTASIQNNRGQEIMRIPASSLPAKLTKVLASDGLIKPLRPILEKVQQKVAPLIAAGELSWLAAVAWCIQHQMVQQGITQLQEGLLTWICQQLAAEKNPHSAFFDWQQKAPRNLISGVLHLCKQEKNPEEWKGELAIQPEITHFLFDHRLMLTWAPHYDSLSKLRNDINHGGYTDNAQAKSFEKKLKEHYQAVQAGLGLYER
ncbi:MAG: hypothetical protein OHK0039_10340 [Bacteroidia bacterium]